MFGTDPECWMCGGPYLYGVPAHVPAGGNHRHDPGSRHATVAGQSVYVTEESATLI